MYSTRTLPFPPVIPTASSSLFIHGQLFPFIEYINLTIRSWTHRGDSFLGDVGNMKQLSKSHLLQFYPSIWLEKFFDSLTREMSIWFPILVRGGSLWKLLVSVEMMRKIRIEGVFDKTQRLSYFKKQYICWNFNPEANSLRLSHFSSNFFHEIVKSNRTKHLFFIFTYFLQVSLDPHLFLFEEDVRHNWQT